MTETTKYKSLTGYGDQFMQLRYITVWHGLMATKGAMKFYPGNPSSLVDVAIGDTSDELLVYTYPNSTAKVREQIAGNEGHILHMIDNAQKTENRKVFTLDTDHLMLLTAENFTSYSYDDAASTFVFIFLTDDKAVQFPSVFCISPPVNGMHKLLFKVQNMSSQWIMPCAGEPTKFGEEFTYTMLRSHISQEFVAQRPDMKDVRLPTMSDTHIPDILNMVELKNLAAISRADKVIQSLGEVTYLKEEDEIPGIPSLPMLPAPPVRFADDEIDSEFGSVSEEATKSLVLMIQRQILDKNSVRLSDIYTLGLIETLKAIVNSSNVLKVDLDVAGVARKMCIFEGTLYIVPMDGDDTGESWGQLFNGGEAYIMEVSEEEFPSRAFNALHSDNTRIH